MSVLSESHSEVRSINLFGPIGSGKSRMIHEVVEFLRFRYYFGAGVFIIDMKIVKDFE